MAVARDLAYTTCIQFGGLSDYCQANAEAGAAELVSNCTNDTGKCCTDLTPIVAEQILGIAGACNY